MSARVQRQSEPTKFICWWVVKMSDPLHTSVLQCYWLRLHTLVWVSVKVGRDQSLSRRCRASGLWSSDSWTWQGQGNSFGLWLLTTFESTNFVLDFSGIRHHRRRGLPSIHGSLVSPDVQYLCRCPIACDWWVEILIETASFSIFTQANIKKMNCSTCSASQ